MYLNEKESVYVTIKAYLANRNIEKNKEILINTKYPDFLVPLAYNHLKDSKILIERNVLINLTDIRLEYGIKLLIKYQDVCVFSNGNYLKHICSYFEDEEINKFLEENILRYTLEFLSKNNFEDFICIWKKLIVNLKNFEKLIQGIKLHNSKFFIENLCKNENEIKNKYKEYFISNRMFLNEYQEEKSLEILNLITLLSTHDTRKKEAMLKECYFNKKHKEIILINLSLFNINQERVKFNKEGILNGEQHFEFSEYDSLEMREIKLFFSGFSFRELYWHRYFKICESKNYDDVYISTNLFKQRSLDTFFSKNDLKMILKELKLNLEELIILSLKNPEIKVYLKNEISKILENTDSMGFNEQNQSIEEALKVIGKNYFLILFNKFFKKHPLVFVRILNYFILCNEIDHSIYEEEILIEYEKKDERLFPLICEYFSFFDLKHIEEIIRNFLIVDPLIFKNIHYASIINYFKSFDELICFLMNDISLNEINLKLEVRKEKMLELIGYYIDKEKIENSKCSELTIKIDKKYIETEEGFIIDLFFNNLDIEDMINGFYVPDDFTIKLYLPRCWKIYLKRNKIDNLQSILKKKRTTSSSIHVICICIALCDMNIEYFKIAYDFLEGLKTKNEEILFYVLLFIFYVQKKFKDKKLKNLFIKSYQSVKSQDNLFLGSLINILYEFEDEKIDINAKEIAQLLKNKVNSSSNHPILANTKDYEILNVFETEDCILDNRISLFKAIRILDKTFKEFEEPKNEIIKNIIERIKNDVSFLKIFIHVDKLGIYDWSFLESYGSNMLVYQFLVKHYNPKNSSFQNLLKSFKVKHSLFFQHKFFINSLSLEEKNNLSETCDIVDFYKNVEGIVLFDTLNDKSYTVHRNNHYVILDEISKHEITKIKQGMNHFYYNDVLYCILKKFQRMEFEIFYKYLKEIKDVVGIINIRFDWKSLRKNEYLKSLVEEYILYEYEVIKVIILKIFEYDFTANSEENADYKVPLLLSDFSETTKILHLPFLRKFMCFF